MLLFFLFLLLIPFSVLFHELGHATAALVFTKKRVSVFIGSHGNTDTGFNFPIGQFIFYFTYNPLLWKLGLCKYSPLYLSVKQRIIITASGPFASLLLMLPAVWLARIYFKEGGTGLFFVESAIITAIFFFVNIIPSSKKYKLYDGNTFENDGKKIIQLFKQRKLPTNYIYALACYNEKMFLEASSLLDGLTLTKMYGEDFCRNIVSIYISVKDYENALLVHEFLKENFTLNSNDYSDLGIIKGRFGLQQESLAALDESLTLNPKNFRALNNKGALLIEWGEYEEAIPYLDNALIVIPKSSVAYSNRGMAKLKTGDIENGLADLDRSLEIDPNNAKTYINFGTYFLDTGNKRAAIENLMKAKTINNQLAGIDELIAKANNLDEEGE